VLAEHADEPVDIARVVAMVLVHDLVEIDAGDTFAYDETALDRLQPVLLNHAAGTDAPWARHGITYEQIVPNVVIADGSQALWAVLG
jgi:HD domain